MSSMKDQYTITINGFRFVFDFKNGIIPYMDDVLRPANDAGETYYESIQHAVLLWHEFCRLYKAGRKLEEQAIIDDLSATEMLENLTYWFNEGWGALTPVWEDFEAVLWQKMNFTAGNPGFVYLLQSPTGAYKIGRTVNPDDRLKTFSVKLPFEVSYLALIRTNNMQALERALHKTFEHKRINGEWFNLSKRDVEYIRDLAVAS